MQCSPIKQASAFEQSTTSAPSDENKLRHARGLEQKCATDESSSIANDNGTEARTAVPKIDCSNAVVLEVFISVTGLRAGVCVACDVNLDRRSLRWLEHLLTPSPFPHLLCHLPQGVPAVPSWSVLEWKHELKKRGLVKGQVADVIIKDENDKIVADRTCIRNLSPHHTYRIS